jgi:hypothetical protein
MKFISQSLKIVGILILIISSICIPIAIISADFVNLVLEPGEIVKIIDKELLDGSVFAAIAEDTVTHFEQREIISTLSAPQRAIVTALDELSDNKWEDFFSLIMPSKLVKDSLEEIDDGFFEWLNSGNDRLDYEFDTTGLKDNIINNISPAINLVFDELPSCTVNEFIEMNNFILFGANGDINPCKPPEPIYSEAATKIEQDVIGLVESVNDDIQFDNLFEGYEDQVRKLKTNLLISRTISRYGLILVLFVFIVAVGLSTRSVKDFFLSLGWPLLMVSLPLVVVGFVIKFVPYNAAYQVLLSRYNWFPEYIYRPIVLFLDNLLSNLGSGYLLKGLIILGVGIASIVTGYITVKFIEKK